MSTMKVITAGDVERGDGCVGLVVRAAAVVAIAGVEVVAALGEIENAEDASVVCRSVGLEEAGPSLGAADGVGVGDEDGAGVGRPLNGAVDGTLDAGEPDGTLLAGAAVGENVSPGTEGDAVVASTPVQFARPGSVGTEHAHSSVELSHVLMPMLPRLTVHQ